MKLGKKTGHVVAVSADNPEGIAKMEAKLPKFIKLFSDPELALADALELRDRNGNPMTGADIFRPAKMVVGQDGEVLQIEVRENYRIR